MTEDHEDQTSSDGGHDVAADAAADAAAGHPTAETTAGAVAEGTTEAIPLPEVTPPPPAEAMGAAPTNTVEPVTPVEGTEPVTPVTPVEPVEPVAAVPSEGSTAPGAGPSTPPLGVPMGVPLAGAGYGPPPAGAGYGLPPADPGAPNWAMPPAASATSGSSTHRLRNGLLAGAAAIVVLGAGIGIGHAAWNNQSSTQSFTPSSNSGNLPSGNGNSSGNSGGSSTNPFGNGSPFGGSFGSGNSGSGNSGSGNSGSGSGSSNSSGPSDADAIAAKVDPGLVDVNVTLGYQQEQAAGTGIVLTSNGVVLTNNHVIDGATSISVTDVGNHQTYTASVVGYDRTKDIAVLQLHNASGLQTATLGNSANVAVGQGVVGIGNAGGTGGTPSAAGGTVTALNQSITASDDGDGTSEQLSGLIETNADIQPGDSGGALVNTSGQVIGVDTAASAGFSFQGEGDSSGTQGYAIPINTALTIARAIEAGDGSSTVHIGATAFLGVEIDANGSSSSGSNGSNGFGGFGGSFGNSGNTGSSGSSTSGATVAGVVTNGPAQEAGLAQGDVITSFGGTTIDSADDLTNVISQYHPGDKVSISWTDTSGQTHTATVQLSSGPPQ